MINIRNNCFETNSSSSHSVCISMDSEVSPEINDLIENDTLMVYPRNDKFSNMKTNKCLDKLQFLVSLTCTDVMSTQGHKQIKQLRYRLKNAIGVSNVYLGNVDEYYNALRERKKCGKFSNFYEAKQFIINNFRLCGVVGAYRMDILKEEIFETTETLRSFILSPNSWLYSFEDNDNGNIIKQKEKYYISEETDSIISVKFSDSQKVELQANIMRPDILKKKYYTKDLLGIIESYDRLSIIGSVVPNNQGELVINNSDCIDIGIVGDKYNLAHIYFGNTRKDLIDIIDKACIAGHGDSYNFNHSYLLHKLDCSNSETHKLFEIDIMSDEFFNELIL